MRRWASWWLALQQPAGGRSQMADGEGREGRWWPVGGLARTKPAALRATRLHPCVVTLGLASNTPRRRPLNLTLVSSQRCNVEEEYALVAKHFLVNVAKRSRFPAPSLQ